MRAMVLSAAGLVIRTRRTPYALMLPAYRDDRMHFATGTNRNSAVLHSPHLAWLVDRWAAPSWVPWANVFSVGDVLIMAGGLLFALGATGALRRRSRPQRRPGYLTATR